MYQIVFYVPKKYKESVKEAMFASGAGTIGNYSHCSFETPGRGQFFPMEGSSPSLGKILKLKRLKEYRIEMVCCDEMIDKVINAMEIAHPYEEPAYHFFIVNE